MNDFYYTHPLIPLRAAVEKQKYKNKLSSEKFSLKKKKKIDQQSIFTINSWQLEKGKREKPIDQKIQISIPCKRRLLFLIRSHD